MYACVKTCTTIGIEGKMIQVEVYVSRGIPAFEIVGLPDTSVRESKERVKAAIKNSDFEYPTKKIIVNLAPGTFRKGGAHFDLAIALGILIATGQLPETKLRNTAVVGELYLNGDIGYVEGILPMVISSLKEGYCRFIYPLENDQEANLVDGFDLFPAYNLGELGDWLAGKSEFTSPKTISDITDHVKRPGQASSFVKDSPFEDSLDFNQVCGQEQVKRVLEIAVAGGHNVLMIGPPGTGKSMLASRISSIMPKLDYHDSIEVTKIYSISSFKNLTDFQLITTPPVRMPHHSITGPALIGGGRDPYPGEISLAHKGVLVLDEMPEFNRRTLELMRQPLEDGKITITRQNAQVTYPCEFMLIGTMNPCPCGRLTSKKSCSCSWRDIKAYRNRISGALLDRFDITVEVPQVTFQEIRQSQSNNSSLSSEHLRERIKTAKLFQETRYKEEWFNTNQKLTHKKIESYCDLDHEGEGLLKAAYYQLQLSVRAYDKILKVARTIADLRNSETISSEDVAEACEYRVFDK